MITQFRNKKKHCIMLFIFDAREAGFFTIQIDKWCITVYNLAVET